MGESGFALGALPGPSSIPPEISAAAPSREEGSGSASDAYESRVPIVAGSLPPGRVAADVASAITTKARSKKKTPVERRHPPTRSSRPGEMIVPTYRMAGTTPGATGRRRHAEAKLARQEAEPGTDAAVATDQSDAPDPDAGPVKGTGRQDDARADRTSSARRARSVLQAEARAEQFDVANAVACLAAHLSELMSTILGAVDECEQWTARDAIIFTKGETLSRLVTAIRQLDAVAVEMKCSARMNAPPEEPPGPTLRQLAEQMHAAGLIVLHADPIPPERGYAVRAAARSAGT